MPDRVGKPKDRFSHDAVHIKISVLMLIFIKNVLLAHLSRKLKGELIVYRSNRRPSVRPSTLSNIYMNFFSGWSFHYIILSIIGSNSQAFPMLISFLIVL